MENHPSSQTKQFVQKFNNHYYQTHPSELKPSKLLELVQQLTLHQFQKNKSKNVIVIDQIENLLNQKLQSSKKYNKKNGILIIGAAGVGKTTFMKYYAQKYKKIAIYMNCVELASLLKQQAQQAIDILFQMANFSQDTLFYLDQIDMLFNEDYQYQQITKGKNAIIKNLNDNQYKAPIIFLTNRPWNIECDGLLQHINYAIEIPLFDQEQRKQLIQQILNNIQGFQMQNKQANVIKLVKYTQNFMNSDIYTLIKSIPWERLKEMVEQNEGNIEKVKDKVIVVNERHVQIAMKKIKSSFEVKQIHSFTEWRKKFNKNNQL